MKKRSVRIHGHRTSVSLEDPFWDALREIARARGTTIGALIEHIDKTRSADGLSSAIRLHVLQHYRGQANDAADGLD